MKPAFPMLRLPSPGRIPARLIPLVALVGLLVGPRGAVADVTDTLTTTTAVVPGGTLVTAVPSGVSITATGDVTGCQNSGVGTSKVTYTCDPRGSGVAAGQTMVQSFSAIGRLQETVTYNANGPSPASINPVLGPISTGSCSAGAASTEHALAVTSSAPGALPPETWNCTGSTSFAPGAPGSLQLVVLANPGQTVQITDAPNGAIGGCSGYGYVLPTPASSTDAQVHYQCPSIAIPGGWSFALSVQTTGDRATPSFDLETAPSNAPAGVAPPIPKPTTETRSIGSGVVSLPVANLPTTATFGAFALAASGSSAAPVLAAIDPVTGSPGITTTLTGTGLSGGAQSGGAAPIVMFGTVQATDVTCSDDGTNCSATVPSLDPGSQASVTIANPGGTSNALTFTYTASPNPSPDAGGP
jgi:IPT/TIG domain